MAQKTPTGLLAFLTMFGAACMSPTAGSIEVSPTPCDHTSLNVSVQMYIKGIVEMIEVKQLIVVDVQLFLHWKDAGLTWDPAENNISVIHRVPQHGMCFPELVIESGTKKQILTPASIDHSITIRHTGDVYYFWPFVFVGFCPLKLALYPFDEQTCPIHIYTNLKDHSSVSLIAADVDIIKSVVYNELWFLEGVTVVTGVEPVEPVVDHLLTSQERREVAINWPYIRYDMHLTRMSGFYLWTMFVPSTLIALICVAGIFTPVNSSDGRGEKNRLGMSAFLAMAVQITLIANKLPFTAATPVLSRYYMILLSLIAVTTVLSCYLVAVVQAGFHLGKEIPHWARVVFLNGFGTILCVRTRSHKQERPRSTQETRNVIEVPQLQVQHKEAFRGDGAANSAGSQRQVHPDSLQQEEPSHQRVTTVTIPNDEKKSKEQNKRDWFLLSTVIDRFCLIGSLIILGGSFGWLLSHVKRV